ncbi:hypothetical protein LWF15_16670 [Kineosporia rhizophila]|uniref:hypothetical protein n=1 Tax=Kineosporia TaxID=49184 RepID=UPI001E56F99D|nr:MULTISPECIES: hypothetical protein [Kineosporia]MCE0537138.1 hypothetical protein [Kineosporia rhizophila]
MSELEMSEVDESRTWVFARGSMSAQEIQGVVDEVLAEALSAPGAESTASGQEVLDLTALEERALDLRRTMQVRPSGQGNVPDATQIVIEIGQGLAVKFAWDLWTTRIWPRLTRKAADAIGPRRGAQHRRQ